MSDIAAAQVAGATWAKAIAEIMAEHPEFSEEDANRGLIYAINEDAAKAGLPHPIPTDDAGTPLPPASTDPVVDALALIESGLADLKLALGH